MPMAGARHRSDTAAKPTASARIDMMMLESLRASNGDPREQAGH